MTLTPDWTALGAWLAERYPGDVRMGGAALADALAGPAPPALVDVRTPAEQAVSTLPGALCASPQTPPAEVLARVPQAAPIVVYCAVGLRAARYARALREAGAGDVRNLDGGIFAWANAGRPLAGPAGPATRVHGYDATWEVLLAPGLRAPR